MIEPELADPLRLVNATLALVWLFASMFAVVVADHLDARIRHLFIALIGALLAYSHLISLSRPASWVLPTLTPLMGAMIWSTTQYVRRKLGERHRDR